MGESKRVTQEASGGVASVFSRLVGWKQGELKRRHHAQEGCVGVSWSACGRRPIKPHPESSGGDGVVVEGEAQEAGILVSTSDSRNSRNHCRGEKMESTDFGQNQMRHGSRPSCAATAGRLDGKPTAGLKIVRFPSKERLIREMVVTRVVSQVERLRVPLPKRRFFH